MIPSLLSGTQFGSNSWKLPHWGSDNSPGATWSGKVSSLNVCDTLIVSIATHVTRLPATSLASQERERVTENRDDDELDLVTSMLSWLHSKDGRGHPVPIHVMAGPE